MSPQNGLPQQGKAAKSGTPPSRCEIEEMLAQAAPSEVIAFLSRWLELETELSQLHTQVSHVRETLGDKLLGNILVDRANQMTSTLLRRAADLARLPSCQASDIGAKVYVLSRIEQFGAERSLYQEMCQSILDDVKGLDIAVERFSRND